MRLFDFLYERSAAQAEVQATVAKLRYDVNSLGTRLHQAEGAATAHFKQWADERVKVDRLYAENEELKQKLTEALAEADDVAEEDEDVTASLEALTTAIDSLVSNLGGKFDEVLRAASQPKQTGEGAVLHSERVQLERMKIAEEKDEIRKRMAYSRQSLLTGSGYNFMGRVADERLRQQNAEGYDDKHDSAHVRNELLRAAAAQLLMAAGRRNDALTVWPTEWDRKHLKLGAPDFGAGSVSAYRRMVIACALVLAEVDRVRVLQEKKIAMEGR